MRRLHPLLLALACAAALPGLAGTALANFQVDHYVVYDVDDLIVVTPDVTLEDQFPPDGSHLVAGISHLGLPAAKLPVSPPGPGVPVIRPDEHLSWYVIFPQSHPVRSFQIENQFGIQQIDTFDSDVMLVPAIKNGEVSQGGIQLNQHWQCYDAAGTGPFDTVQVTDQFGPLLVVVGNPVYFCNPARKNLEAPPALPGVHLTCYQITGADLDTTVSVEDQFGDHGATQLHDPQLLCAPTHKVLGAPTMGPWGMALLVGMMVAIVTWGWRVARSRVARIA